MELSKGFVYFTSSNNNKTEKIMTTQQIVTAKVGDKFLFTPNNRVFTVTKISKSSIWTTSPEGVEGRSSWNTWNENQKTDRWEKI